MSNYNNHAFCEKWIVDNMMDRSVRVLDYGCGAGEVVKLLRKHGVSAFGCDIFYGANDRSALVDPSLFGSIIRRMEADGGDYTIPYANDSFDFVINDQVLEHVENLSNTLAEIWRVLKPGGEVLSLFPTRSVWCEVHCGIPFIHWFPKGSTTRVYYAATLRLFGAGYRKENKTPLRWSLEFCEYLDKYTYYRTEKAIRFTFNKYFSDIRHIEDVRLRHRLGKRWALVAWLPRSIQQLVVRKVGGVVFVAVKPVT